LHLAVKRNQQEAIKILLGAKSAQPLLFESRDCEGATALHVAVLAGNAPIVRLLLDAMVESKANISIENAVGDTALEIARQRFILHKTRTATEFGGDTGATILPPYRIDLPKPVRGDASRLNSTLTEFRAAVSALQESGELLADSATTSAFNQFATRMDGLLTIARAKENDKPVSAPAPVHPHQQRAAEPTLTFKYLHEAFERHPSPRQLVHLFDVQNVVKLRLEEQKKAEAATLAQSRIIRSTNRTRRHGGDLDLEQQDEDETKESWPGVLSFNVHAGRWGSETYKLKHLFTEDSN
jgi:hypothetical protein